MVVIVLVGLDFVVMVVLPRSRPAPGARSPSRPLQTSSQVRRSSRRLLAPRSSHPLSPTSNAARLENSLAQGTRLGGLKRAPVATTCPHRRGTAALGLPD